MSDMERPEADRGRRRGAMARIGVALLNVLGTGLGLLRLSRPRAWLGYVLLQAVVTAIFIATVMLVRNISFAGFAILAGITLFSSTAIWLGAVVQSWRSSASIDPAPPWYSRWYGILLAWVVLGAISYPLPDLARHWYRSFYAPSESMSPTVLKGDYFLVDMHIADDLKRGDVVIVRTGKVEYIKRIAALPGDTFAMRGGVPVINGQPVGQTAPRSIMVDDFGVGPIEARVLREQLPGEARAHEVIDMGYSDYDDTPEVRLGKDEYFLLGDNRDRSADSRASAATFGLGVVDRARITGRVLFIFWRHGSGLGKITL
ncbi:MAG: signal peptidase I [Sphingomonas sp.]